MTSDTNSTDGEAIVPVTEDGRVTIPNRIRERHGISAPGRVAFVEKEDKELVVRPIGSMREFRGLERVEDEERPATAILRELRTREACDETES
ncbi:AbrB/MazE/SpoVT family DNA-binding domain-containing protein [Halostagnicola kamekurae]|uniref:Looped-hinge helix DNA binding domain-containing protein, AbrB family n=1 Tax=Halostagnicola kamekurae TaxID=619731 RepID=A0A1I6NZI3_9EURY|nr:AbrB/MazE/SpoVT family DNA-binding domain-containing protein [Halostagnicola kamekurae]SFS33260.1 looped-hinge helix DNA binding domain-containing protein, AbrB family [Halostagnicola kamekurae]